MTTQSSVSLPILAAGSICSLLYLCLARVSRGYGDATLLDAAFVYGGCAVVTLVMVCWLHRFLKHNKSEADRRALVVTVLGFALLFRVFGVATYPVLEDDFFRYLWDGWVFAHTGSPYGVAPEAFFSSLDLSERFEHILDRINYPGVATVYGPTLQWVFGASYLIAPGALWPLQCVAGLADAALVLVLLRIICTDSGQAPELAADWRLPCWVLFAWSPLLIKEFSTTAHPDVLGALLVMLAFLMRQQERWWMVGLTLALAAGVKPFALVFAPFLMGLNWRAFMGFGIAAAVITWPFLSISSEIIDLRLLTQGAFAVWVPEGLRAMGQGWLFNSGLYELASWLGLSQQTLMRQSILSCFVLIWSWQLWLALRGSWSQARLAQTLLWLFGLFLFLLPAINPWYLIWLLPFAVLSPQIAPWVASFAVFASYMSGINIALSEFAGQDGAGGNAETLLYALPGWVLALEFGVIGLALAMDLFFRRQKLQRDVSKFSLKRLFK